MMPGEAAAPAIEKEPLSPEAALEFVNQNKFSIPSGVRLAARCVDGRYRAVAAEAAPLARAGADAGYLMAALPAARTLGVHIEKEDVLRVVIESAGGADKFRFHTDEHAEHSHAGVCMGCGHFKNAAQVPGAYRLTAEDIRFVQNSLLGLLSRGGRQEVLAGAHGERAVCIVESDAYSLAPQGAEDVQVFVYQKTLDSARTATLAAALFAAAQKSKPYLTAEALAAAIQKFSDTQFAETVRRLAANLPLYQIEIDDTGTVKFAESDQKVAT